MRLPQFANLLPCQISRLPGIPIVTPIQEAIDIVVKEEYEVMAVVSHLGCEEGGSEELWRKLEFLSIFSAGELTNEYDRSAETTGNASQSAHPQSSHY